MKEIRKKASQIIELQKSLLFRLEDELKERLSSSLKDELRDKVLEYGMMFLEDGILEEFTNNTYEMFINFSEDESTSLNFNDDCFSESLNIFIGVLLYHYFQRYNFAASSYNDDNDYDED